MHWALLARFGLPEEIITNARSIMSKGSQEVEAMLVDLAGERKRLEGVKLFLEKEKARSQELAGKLESELARIREKERDMVRAIQDNLNKEIAGLYRTIRDAENELKKQKSRGACGTRQKGDGENKQGGGPAQ